MLAVRARDVLLLCKIAGSADHGHWSLIQEAGLAPGRASGVRAQHPVRISEYQQPFNHCGTLA